ncbi:thioesterase II family protein [Paenibacillus monticola]|uniref:thioesterase II family protein n=1 Tax=Paenibacillus monticola TaxID=2666075 RepID=UPI0012ACD430|nr:thioesterase domain-containing protein [Paenibacillus monticola]
MKIKLFCIPYAGGSAVIYHSWKTYLNEQIELIPLELPGRGTKAKQPLQRNVQEIVAGLYDIVKESLKCDEDYAIFGHSMGSTIAFELYHELIKNGFHQPVHFFVSAGRSPDSIKEKIVHNLPEEEFKQVILEYGASSSIIFENEELRSFFVPILRADFEVIENYTSLERNRKIGCGMTAFYGSEDTGIKRTQMGEWKIHASGLWKIHCIPGGHFFIKESPKQVVAIVNEAIFSTENVKSYQES